MITVSIVSHRHGQMVSALLEDLVTCGEVTRIVLTLNVSEPDFPVPRGLESKIKVLKNKSPKGYGANHNASFAQCDTRYFCVLNPDIRLHANPFAGLVQAMVSKKASVAAPAITKDGHCIEDSVRRFPTPLRVVCRTLRFSDGRYEYRLDDEPFEADWVAGMFMLFDASAYRAVGGFDERFFLYLEDVDICARAWNKGHRILVHPGMTAVHHAQRASHKNLRHFVWHISSMVRFFLKYKGRLPYDGRHSPS